MNAFVYVRDVDDFVRTDSNCQWMIYNFVPERDARISE